MTTKPSSHANAAVAEAARRAGLSMASSLKALLDKVPGARGALPHLAALENALVTEGTDVLDHIKLPSLKKMGSQLAALPLDPNDQPLRALQIKLRTAALKLEEASLPKVEHTSFLPSQLDESRVQITEVSATEWASIDKTSP